MVTPALDPAPALGCARPAPVATEPIPCQPADERQLVEAARTDPDAFAALYRAYVDRVYGFALRRTRSAAVAEDVTSATFERVLRGLPGFAWRGGGFGPWVFRIAANELTDHFRREQRCGTAVRPEVAHDTAADGIVLRAEVDAALHALDRLNPRYQRAIALRYLAGLSHEDAAAAMGCTKPVMAVTVHRALAALRKQLDRDEGTQR